MTDCKKAKRSALAGLKGAVKRLFRSLTRCKKDGESAVSRQLERVNFSVSGDLGKDDKTLEMNKNYSKGIQNLC